MKLSILFLQVKTVLIEPHHVRQENNSAQINQYLFSFYYKNKIPGDQSQRGILYI